MIEQIRLLGDEREIRGLLVGGCVGRYVAPNATICHIAAFDERPQARLVALIATHRLTVDVWRERRISVSEFVHGRQLDRSVCTL
jgi:hypothetical protein